MQAPVHGFDNRTFGSSLATINQKAPAFAETLFLVACTQSYFESNKLTGLSFVLQNKLFLCMKTDIQTKFYWYPSKMLARYKAVIYDWDGCLVQSLDVWASAFKSVLSKIGIYPATTEIMQHLGNWKAAAILGHTNLELANQEIVDYVREHIKNAALYPNAHKTIQDLKNELSVALYIVSANKRLIVEPSKAYKKIESMIDFTVFVDDVKRHKPDPEAINLLLNKFKLKTNEVLLVGDSAKDMMAAYNAGIDSALFTPEINKNFHSYNQTIGIKPTLKIKDHVELIPSCVQMSLAS